jgi:hypothetical protein
MSICADYAPYFLKFNLHKFPAKQKQCLSSLAYILLKCTQHNTIYIYIYIYIIFMSTVWHFKLWKSSFIYPIRFSTMIQPKIIYTDTKHMVTRSTGHGWHHSISKTRIFTFSMWNVPVNCMCVCAYVHARARTHTHTHTDIYNTSVCGSNSNSRSKTEQFCLLIFQVPTVESTKTTWNVGV